MMNVVSIKRNVIAIFYGNKNAINVMNQVEKDVNVNVSRGTVYVREIEREKNEKTSVWHKQLLFVRSSPQ